MSKAKQILMPIPMLLMLALPYSVIFLFLTMGMQDIFLIVSVTAIVIIDAVNIAYPFILGYYGKTGQKLLFWSMLLKIVNIPIFSLVFFAALIGNVMMIPLIPFMVAFDYCLLFPSSMYGLSGIVQSYHENKLSKAEAIVFGIMQFFFVLDVLSSLTLYITVISNNKKLKKASMTEM